MVRLMWRACCGCRGAGRRFRCRQSLQLTATWLAPQLGLQRCLTLRRCAASVQRRVATALRHGSLRHLSCSGGRRAPSLAFVCKTMRGACQQAAHRALHKQVLGDRKCPPSSTGLTGCSAPSLRWCLRGGSLVRPGPVCVNVPTCMHSCHVAHPLLMSERVRRESLQLATTAASQ